MGKERWYSRDNCRASEKLAPRRHQIFPVPLYIGRYSVTLPHATATCRADKVRREKSFAGRGEGEGGSWSGGLDEQVREIKTTLATIQAHSTTIKRNMDLLKGTGTHHRIKSCTGIGRKM